MRLPPLPLTTRQKLVRIALVTGILAALLTVAVCEPGNPLYRALPRSWIQEYWGIPCPLCGGTRATHYLLRMDLERAWYYNWLAFPSVFFLIYVAVQAGMETVLNRRLPLPDLRFRRQTWWLVIAVWISAWILQLFQTFYLGKYELIHPDSPVYHWIRRK